MAKADPGGKRLKDMPEVGYFEQGREDPTTGLTWVYVTREMAHAHPKGKLGLILYAIVLYAAASAAVKIGLAIQVGYWGLWVAGIINLLTALGLLFRLPWSMVLAVLQAVFPLIGFTTSLTREPNLLFLGEAIFVVFIIFYLIDGERPNLIYRYRYRSVSGSPQGTARAEDEDKQ